MSRKQRTYLIIALLALIVVACQSEPEVIVVTEVVQSEVEVEVTSTPPPKVEPTSTTTAEPEQEPTEEQTEEPTRSIPPMMATLTAVAEQVTISTRSPGESAVIAEDDYPALLDQGCQIVVENYYRGDFNGVDWQAVCDEYRQRVANIEDQEAFWDLMGDLIMELGDEHSRFIRPDENVARFELPGEREGRPGPGFLIWPAREDEYVYLWDVCRSGPANSAGLQRGDIVLAINDVALERSPDGFDRSVIYQLLYEKEDSAELLVQRGPETDPELIELRFGGASGCDGWTYGAVSLEPYLGYIRIPNFSGNASDNIMEAINLLEQDQPLDGLILDERHNPGGNSDDSIPIFTMGTFGTVGKLREDSSRQIYRIRGPVLWNETTPVVLLTDGNSHSAADYFAIAMKLSGRATLVGMPTAGNTDGWSSFNLADGSLIGLSVTIFALPDGTLIEDIGLMPDVQVPLGEWGLREQPDVQLKAAVELLMDQING